MELKRADGDTLRLVLNEKQLLIIWGCLAQTFATEHVVRRGLPVEKEAIEAMGWELRQLIDANNIDL